MNNQRKYDQKLVQEIQRHQYVQQLEGMDVLFKPVPDDLRKHIMDPRIYTIAKQKMEMFGKRAQKGYCLSHERYRPDKVSYDLTQEDIDVDERLIPVNQDHMIDIFLFRRKDELEKNLPVMVYLHGGGWVAGDIHLYEKQMKWIAEQGHAVVVFPEYRLAPETPYPGAIDDCYATIRYLFENADELNIDRSKIMVAGDSAGGALTNACVLKDIQDQKMIRKVFELYPAFDARNPNRIKEYTWSYDAYPMEQQQADVICSRIDRIRLSYEKTSEDNLYIQRKTTLDDPLLSPICASDDLLKQFPEMIICNAEFDYLRIGSEYAAKKFHSLGVLVKLVTYCGCDHGFLDHLGIVVQAEEVCLMMAEEIQKM